MSKDAADDGKGVNWAPTVATQHSTTLNRLARLYSTSVHNV